MSSRKRIEQLSQQPETVINQRRLRINQNRLILSFLLRLAFTGIVLVLIFRFLFGIGVMHGEEMYPRMRDGDMYLYYRLEQEYHIGDVVTFTRENTRYVARIVALGGDTVDMSAEGELLINGNIQEEEIFYPTTKSEAAVVFPYVVEENSYFLLVDFRTAGKDSRTYGAVSRITLEGKVISLLRRRGI